MTSTVSADNCTIYVGRDGVPTVEAAQAERRSAAFRAGCQREVARVVLQVGVTHYVQDPPLRFSALDSDTVWTSSSSDPSQPAILSAGKAVPDACWRSSPGVKWWCGVGQSLSFRTITMGGRLLRQARWPDHDPAAPFTGGWLFVNSSTFVGKGTFIIGVAAATLPPFALAPGWRGAHIHIFPTRSWINLVNVSIKPAAAPATASSALRHFEVVCPGSAGARLCSNRSNSAAIGPGNRFFIEGAAEALSVGEWAYDATSGELSIGATSRPAGVVVPRGAAVLALGPAAPPPARCAFNQTMRGRSPGSALAILPATNMSFEQCQAACCARQGCKAVNMSPQSCYLLGRTFEGDFINGSNRLADRVNTPATEPGPHNMAFHMLAFADTTFTYDGYQEGFSLTADAAGMPRDAAVQVARARNINISRCTFVQLAGGGVHITDGSSDVHVTGSVFRVLGQSGVTVSGGGGGSLQPVRVTVSRNTMEDIGTILASAAGIVASTVSFANFTENNITGTPRWGIAIRSDFQGAVVSSHNRVERNRLHDLARSTRDLGGLSFIGAGHTDSVVRHNCVKRVTGLDTDPAGRFLTPYFNWGVYLDNNSSFFTVDSNILSGNVLGAVFVHGGSGNNITNNICYNTSNASMPGFGEHGHTEGSRGLLLGTLGKGTLPRDNRWERNVVLGSNDRASRSRMAVIATTQPLNFSTHYAQGLVVSSNTYFSPLTDLAADPLLTPLGGWDSWRAAGYDASSFISDPLFVDPAAGNFGMHAGSPALAAGFVPLPTGLDQC